MLYEIIFGLIVFLSIALISDADISSFRIGNFVKDLQASDNDSDSYLTPVQLISKYGYPAEAHIIQSQGYFLELHRIPHGKRGPGNDKKIPILLHHGLFLSSSDWIINGPDKSLGYRLADEGYDVWLPNMRGNTFSRGHVKYNPRQSEFWDYSFHEVGVYDMPATIDYILNITGEEQLVFIGYSLGTTVFYTMASSLPEYAHKKVMFHISLAPVGAIPHATSLLRLLIPYAKMTDDLTYWYNKRSLMEHDLFFKSSMQMFCSGKSSTLDYRICELYIMFSVCGDDPDQFNASLLPIFANNIPAGTSSKSAIHTSQLITRGVFAQFDYGEAENIKKYGTPSPPEYNLSAISVPMRIYYGENDLLSSPLDSKLLYQKLAKPLGLVRVNCDKFNHIDFLWAKDINTLLNDEVIEFIKNSTDRDTGINFIQDTVIRAVDVRNRTEPPVDVPFDEKQFLTKMAHSLSAFSALPLPSNPNELMNYPEQVIKEAFSKVAEAKKAIEDAVAGGVKQVQTIGDKLKSRAIEFKNTINHEVQDLKNGIKTQIDELGKVLKQ